MTESLQLLTARAACLLGAFSRNEADSQVVLDSALLRLLGMDSSVSGVSLDDRTRETLANGGGQVPTFSDPKDAEAFLLGVFEAGAEVTLGARERRVELSVTSAPLIEWVMSRCGPADTTRTGISYEGDAALDCLGKVYSPFPPRLGTALSSTFAAWCGQIDLVTAPRGVPLGVLRVERMNEQAVMPSKERVSDSGYDVTITDIKKVLGKVTLFGTGLRVQPPNGWYFDVVPRSSIIKRGYRGDRPGVPRRAHDPLDQDRP